MERELTRTQLEVVVHVANGMRYDEIAVVTHRSESSVRKIIKAARGAAGAKTTPHLVSMVIASGVLEWTPGTSERRINGSS
jgi:DNA-binding CsgD family transcriptional regulator